MSSSFAIDKSSSLRLELTTAQAICRVIDSPRSLTVQLLIDNQEWEQLVDLDCDPLHYNKTSQFRDDMLVTSLLSKSSKLPLKVDKQQVALDMFYVSEGRCKSTNDKFLARPTLPNRVKKAKEIIARVLGPLTREDLQFVEENFRFGPGATTGVRGSGSVLSDKYDEEIHLTADLIPFYRSMIGDRWWGYKTQPVVVEGNKFTTVPKNAKTDRGICIEPTLNIYGQLGVGALLRKRLERLGIDLSDQERNKTLAKEAYSKSLATIDLSAASDSLAWSVVMELLPPDWFELLETFRSSHSYVGDDLVELEKFSSMGNGYTFELESLIFGAVAHACTRHDDLQNVSVYGDDIIVPQYASRDVIDALEFLGFSVNESKSFLAGNFYESCGTDWFCGQYVRPFFLRQVKDKIPYPVQIANSLRLYSYNIMNGVCCDIRFKKIWEELVALSPSIWRKCKVPPSLGDSGIISNQDEASCPRLRDGLQGWSVQHMRMTPIKRRKTSFGRLLAALACPAPDISTQGREPRRGYLGKPVPKKVIVFQWPCGLDWF